MNQTLTRLTSKVGEKTRVDLSGIVFDIQGYAVHDGPGCRTLVFLSGCDLRCDWCANPEGTLARPRLLFSASRCPDRCDRCVSACPHDAVTVSEDREPRVAFDRALCDECEDFACVDGCYHQALRVCGRRVTVPELMKTLERDRNYWGPGGGVTFTGGEPLYQHAFLFAALDACRQSRMHTALETSAHAPRDIFLGALERIDWCFTDIKHMDPDAHRRRTGEDNVLILENIRAAAKADWDGRLLPRVPLVPGFNDTAANLDATADFLLDIGCGELQILPFHRLADSKYTQLGQESPFATLAPPSAANLDLARDLLESRGLTCYIGADISF